MENVHIDLQNNPQVTFYGNESAVSISWRSDGQAAALWLAGKQIQPQLQPMEFISTL